MRCGGSPQPAVIFDRAAGYLGVMIDISSPADHRAVGMFTSRAEYG